MILRIGLYTLLIAASAFPETTFEAIRKKPLWLDQKGTVRIDDSGVSFTPAGKDEKTRTWSYRDIQHLDRISTTAFALLSYEDVAWKLGRDRTYRFEITSGEFSDALFEQVASRIGKPATDRVTEAPATAEQEIPAKRLETFGGAEGDLYFSPERIVFSSEAAQQSREWTIERDVASVWSSDPYRLEIHAWEGSPGAFRKPRVYKFALKAPLNAEFYRRLKLRLYDLDRARGLTP